VIPGIGKTIPVFNLASNHQWNVTLSDVEQFFGCFFSSDHGGMSTVVAHAAPMPHSGNSVILDPIASMTGFVAFILKGM
jgi:hypothetical protein